MKHGFIKVGSATPQIRVADIDFNVESILRTIDRAKEEKIKLLVFPELCLTGYTVGDLIYQDALQNGVMNALIAILKATEKIDMLIFIGVPLKSNDKLYNTAVAINKGKILGVVPKTFLPNYNEFYEKRYFDEGPKENGKINLFNSDYPFGTKLLFECKGIKNFVVGAEICEDLWAMSPPSISHAMAGGFIIVNLSASPELLGKAYTRRQLVKNQSSKLICGYIYSNIGEGESTTDLIYSGHSLIAENGSVLKELPLFSSGIISTEIDLSMLYSERIKISKNNDIPSGYDRIYFDMQREDTPLSRTFSKYPFIPEDEKELKERTELILTMQSYALKKRLEHTNAKKVLLGISGGLDSTLALLAAVRTMELMKRPNTDIIGITMPCFGTTNRTYKNSCQLAKELAITFETIDITGAVTSHLELIGHSKNKFDAAYENAQARERMQILMDKANMTGGIVLGSGDLSELALGWTTYNGDHMSMYSLNSSIPKTLIKHIIKYEGERRGNKELQKILMDIIDTPISPELLPTEEGKIVQKTEDAVGPYALNDFFIYHTIRMRFTPSKILYLAKKAFKDDYSSAEIEKWLTVFIRRFFGNQFKRNCMPDGVKVGSVNLSPRADWKMPSDASPELWLNDLKKDSFE